MNGLLDRLAYMMYSGDGDKTGSKTDSFRRSIVDTLVGEIQSEPGEDRCVLLLGYEEPMSEMLQNSNPGLSRRFPLSDAFTTVSRSRSLKVSCASRSKKTFSKPPSQQ